LPLRISSTKHPLLPLPLFFPNHRRRPPLSRQLFRLLHNLEFFVFFFPFLVKNAQGPQSLAITAENMVLFLSFDQAVSFFSLLDFPKRCSNLPSFPFSKPVFFLAKTLFLFLPLFNNDRKGTPLHRAICLRPPSPSQTASASVRRRSFLPESPGHRTPGATPPPLLCTAGKHCRTTIRFFSPPP